MQWSGEPHWIFNVTIDVQAKMINGASGNGVSFSSPFALTSGSEHFDGHLTDDQIQTIHDTLAGLPVGKAVADIGSDYSHDLRLAFHKNGTLQARHYSADHLPESLAQLGKTLHWRCLSKSRSKSSLQPSSVLRAKFNS